MLPLLDHETLFRESERKWEQTSDRERMGERTEKKWRLGRGHRWLKSCQAGVILYTQFKLTQVYKLATGVTGV